MRSALARPASRLVELIRQRPGAVCKASFDHVRFGGIDDQRHANGRRQRFDQAAHQLGFIGPLGQRGAQVQAVRAAVHLLAGQLESAVKIFGQDQLLEFQAALGVEALADQEGRRLLLHGHRLGGGGQARQAGGRAG